MKQTPLQKLIESLNKEYDYLRQLGRKSIQTICRIDTLETCIQKAQSLLQEEREMVDYHNSADYFTQNYKK